MGIYVMPSADGSCGDGDDGGEDNNGDANVGNGNVEDAQYNADEDNSSNFDDASNGEVEGAR